MKYESYDFKLFPKKAHGVCICIQKYIHIYIFCIYMESEPGIRK